jgi:mono/diheme cytochrome c family protein
MGRAMRRIIGAFVLAMTAVAVAGGGFIYSGLYNVAATDPHWPIMRWAMESIRTRSIEAHAAGIAVPPGLDDPVKLPIGVEHFAAHCALCHGAPGVPRGDIAKGMYPAPPDLAHSATHYSDAELFWIIKMTGMPAWADHNDAELWATVAFIKKLGSGMSEAEYGALIRANMGHGMSHHMGGAAMPGMAHDGHPD